MDGQAETVGQRVDQVGEAFGTLVDEARRAAVDLSDALALKERVRAHPVLALVGAAGVGYVLGGGLFTPLTGRLLRAGLRLAALPLVRDELAGLLEGLASASSAAGRPPPERPLE